MSSHPNQVFYVVAPSTKDRVARIEVNDSGFVIREAVDATADPELLERSCRERDQLANFLRATDMHWRNRLKAPPGTFPAAGSCLFTFETMNIIAGPLVLSVTVAAMLPPEEMAEVTHSVSVTVLEPVNQKSWMPLAKIALNGHLPLGEKVGTRTLVVEQLNFPSEPIEVIVAEE